MKFQKFFNDFFQSKWASVKAGFCCLDQDDMHQLQGMIEDLERSRYDEGVADGQLKQQTKMTHGQIVEMIEEIAEGHGPDYSLRQELRTILSRPTQQNYSGLSAEIGTTCMDSKVFVNGKQLECTKLSIEIDAGSDTFTTCRAEVLAEKISVKMEPGQDYQFKIKCPITGDELRVVDSCGDVLCPCPICKGEARRPSCSAV